MAPARPDRGQSRGKAQRGGQRSRQGQAARGRGGSAAVATRSAQAAPRAAGGNGAEPAGPLTADAAGGGAPTASARRVIELLPGPPRWLTLSAFGLSIAGLGVSIYLTVAHYFASAVTLACPRTSTFNCEKVTTSPESYVFHVPVAVLGLAFFVFMVAVNSPIGWRSPLRAAHIARLISVIAGIAFVLYLIYVELLKVNAICLWCTSVHVITFVLFCLIVFSAASWGTARTR
jgi:uncharacterized membrane protein